MEQLIPEDLGIVADLGQVPEHLLDRDCEGGLVLIGSKVRAVKSWAPHEEIVDELPVMMVVKERPASRLDHAIESAAVDGNSHCRLAASADRPGVIEYTVSE